MTLVSWSYSRALVMTLVSWSYSRALVMTPVSWSYSRALVMTLVSWSCSRALVMTLASWSYSRALVMTLVSWSCSRGLVVTLVSWSHNLARLPWFYNVFTDKPEWNCNRYIIFSTSSKNSNLILFGAIFDSYRKNLIALGDESCSSCRKPRSGICIPVYGWPHCDGSVC
jgi:hypothetical protein